MDVDTALSEVPVNILPLLDDTDFKTRETAITYDQAGMDLVWNFVTTGGAFTQTAVTPTTAGNYDWTHQGDGMYTIEIPASGGASINNDTEGFGWFTGFATGVLPWRGPVIGFRASGLNDLLIDSAYSATRGLAGTALPAAAADAAGGLIISDAGGLDADAQRSDVAAILVDTSTTIDDLVDDLETRLGTPSNLGSGASIAANLVDIEAQTDDIGAAGAGLTAVPWNAAWDAEVESEANDALIAQNLDHLVKAAVDTNFATTVHLDSVVGYLADAGGTATYDRTTDALEVLGAATAPSAASIADAVWDEPSTDHLTSGTTGAALNAAGSAGDPWGTPLPGAYGAGTGGYIIGTNLDATVSSRLPTTDYSAAPSAASVADAVWDEDATAHQTTGTFGQAIGDPVSDTDTLWYLVNANLDTTVSSRMPTTDYTAPLDAAGVRSAVGLASANLDTQLDALPTAAENADAVWDEDATAHQTTGTFGQAIGDPVSDTDTIWGLANTNLDATVSSRASQTSVDTIDDFLDTEVAAILEDTGTTLPAQITALNNLSAAQVNAEVVDVLRTDTLPDSVSADGSAATIAQAVYMILQFLTEKAVSGTTVTVKKPDGSTSLMTFTLNDGTSPTSITRAT